MKLSAAATLTRIGVDYGVPAVSAGGPGSGCRGPNCGRPKEPQKDYAGPPIPVSEVRLTREEDAVELKFREYIMDHLAEVKAEYRKRFGNVLDADKAKELSPDYVKDRNRFASAVHEPSSFLIKGSKEAPGLYQDMLKEKPASGHNNTVLFMSGGAASGKTTAIEGNPDVKALVQKSHIVYDGTGTNMGDKISQALAAGKQAHIVYVFRDPKGAFLSSIDRAKEDNGNGRALLLTRLADQHIASRQGIEAMAEKYKDNPNVKITIIDNSRGFGNAKVSSLKELPDIERDKMKLRGELKDALDKEHKEGRVSDKLYTAIIGQGIEAKAGRTRRSFSQRA